MPQMGEVTPSDVADLIAVHAAIAAAHHAKTTLFTELTDRAGKNKLNWALNKLLLGAGPGSDPTLIDLPPGGYTEGAKVALAAPYSVPNNTNTYILFTVEDYDTDNIHDNAVNPDRLTCKTAGVYVCSGSVRWGAYSGTSRIAIVGSEGPLELNEVPGNPLYTAVAGIHKLAVGQYVRLLVQQTSGAAIDVGVDPATRFSMQRIG